MTGAEDVPEQQSHSGKAIYSDLAGKVVVISGGASGIGADLVRAFVAQGAAVTFTDIDDAAADALTGELAGKGPGVAKFEHCDVTDTLAHNAVIDALAREAGPLDVLVNNAANDVRHAFAHISDADFDRLISINLKHQLFAAQAAFAHMRGAGRGSVINFSSVAPSMRIPDLAVYGTAKAGIHGLTRMLAREFGRAGVRVNTVIPGYVFTPKQIALWFTPDVVASVMAQQCIEHRLTGADIANLVLFLASDVSMGCTSQAFTMDAGLT